MMSDQVSVDGKFALLQADLDVDGFLKAGNLVNFVQSMGSGDTLTRRVGSGPGLTVTLVQGLRLPWRCWVWTLSSVDVEGSNEC